MSVLFTSVPVDSALRVIKDLLGKDPTIKDRAVLPVEDIILLLEFCLEKTYFSFQGWFYEQVKGVAVGSPVSPIVANLFMEYFEQKALSPVLSTMKSTNSVDPAIQFTVETKKEDGAIPFLDTIVKPEADGTVFVTVYRKPPHMDQYLQWESHHHLSAKFSVIHTLSHRAQTVCSNPELLHKEKAHLRNALTQCNYPKWASDKVERRHNRPSREAPDRANKQGTGGAQPVTNEVKTKGHIVIPYTQGLFESIKKICGRYGIQTYFEGSDIIRNLLVSPRRKTLWSAKVGPYIGSNVVTSPVMMNT